MLSGEKEFLDSFYKLIHQCQVITDIGEICTHALNILKNIAGSKYFYAVVCAEDNSDLPRPITVGNARIADKEKPLTHCKQNNYSEKPIIKIRKKNQAQTMFWIIDIVMGKHPTHLLYTRIWARPSVFPKKFIENYFGMLNKIIENKIISEENRLFKIIMEHSYNSIEVTDEEAVIEYVNPAFEKVTQYHREDAIGKTVASLLRSPAESPGLFEEIKKCLQKGEVWKGHFKSLRKNKSTWHALASIIPFKRNDKVIKHIAIKQDLTEQTEQSNKLKTSEQKYRHILNATVDPIIVHDLNGRIVEVNQAACLVLKYTREELLNFHVWDIETGVNTIKLNQIWSILEKEPLLIEGTHRNKDGQYYPVEVKLSSFIVENEKLVIAMIKDISDRKIAEAKIRKLTSAVEQSPVFVFITDIDGVIEYANRKVIEKTGYVLSEVVGKKLSLFVDPKDDSLNEQKIWSDLQNGRQWQGELLYQTKNENSFWVSVRMSPLRNEEENIHHFLVVMEDITQKKSYEAILKHQALNDHLTHLPNRFHGINHLETILAEKKNSGGSVTVFFLDLDAFKKVNDTLGHSTGDKLLKEISARFINVCRPGDMIIRLGGDEFMVIIEECSKLKDLEKIAQKFLDICTQPFLIDGYELLTTASIGIAVYPQHGKDAKSLMSHADTAMYESKRSGKNCWTFYNKNIHHVTKRYIDVKAEIIKSFERNEMELFYQPIIDIESRQIVGAESLLRWHHKSLGYVDPEQAIMIAEETGFIHQLGLWALNKACLKAKIWNQRSAHPLFISVNISPIQLKNKSFARRLSDVLVKSELLPQYLYLEITENALIDNSKDILTQLSSINENGIQCTIDDFGTGYSSLKYLKNYPFKCLKIDKSFIHGLQSNSNDIHLVNSIIAMCQNLNLRVIAEGVETLEQLEILKKLSCKYMQGWYFDNALNEEEFLKRIL